MAKASDNAFPSLLITEGTEPSAPAAGKQRLYIDSTTHKLKRTDSSGTDVTIEASAGAVASDTIWDAKGDLAAGTAADTAAKVTVGANGTHLVADSAQSTGLKWLAFSSTLVRRTTAQNVSGSGTETAISFDTETEDLDGVWAIGNPTKLIIPAGLNGRRAIVFGGAQFSASTSGNYRTLRIKKGGANVTPDIVVNVPDMASGFSVQTQIQTNPIVLATAEEFELYERIDSTGVGIDLGYFGLYTVD